MMLLSKYWRIFIAVLLLRLAIHRNFDNKTKRMWKRSLFNLPFPVSLTTKRCSFSNFFKLWSKAKIGWHSKQRVNIHLQQVVARVHGVLWESKEEGIDKWKLAFFFNQILQKSMAIGSNFITRLRFSNFGWYQLQLIAAIKCTILPTWWKVNKLILDILILG